MCTRIYPHINRGRVQVVKGPTYCINIVVLSHILSLTPRFFLNYFSLFNVVFCHCVDYVAIILPLKHFLHRFIDKPKPTSEEKYIFKIYRTSHFIQMCWFCRQWQWDVKRRYIRRLRFNNSRWQAESPESRSQVPRGVWPRHSQDYLGAKS